MLYNTGEDSPSGLHEGINFFFLTHLVIFAKTWWTKVTYNN